MGLFSGLNFNVRKLFGGTFYSRLQSNYMIGSKSPIWIDTKDLGCIYESIPEVSLVIDAKATMFANMVIKCIDQEGEEVQHPVLEMLQKPNPLQTQNEWLGQYMVKKSVYGNAFVNKIQATTLSPVSTMYVLPSEFMVVKPTGKMFKQSDINEIIDYYCLKLNDKQDMYTPDEIMHKNDIGTNNYLASESRLIALKMPISNIEGAYKTRNVLINEKGAIGILSNNNKDSDGGIPLNPEEKQRIQDDYQNMYGNNAGQNRILISNSNLQWQPMSSGVKDLMVFEEVEEDFNKIVDAFGLNLNIFSNSKGSTFENQKQGMKSVYENTIQPEADDLMQGLTDFLGLKDEGLMLKADYSHLPLMQEDEKAKADTLKVKADAVSILMAQGLIDEAEAQIIIGV